MTTKIKEQTGTFIKRQAKKIASQQNIPHHEALNVSAVAAGFKNWNHFINCNKASTIQNRSPKDMAIQIPSASSKNVSARPQVNPHRNLLVAGINLLIDNNRITLDNKNQNPTDSDREKGHLICDLFGYTSVLLWEDIGFEEIRVSVWWKYNHALHPQANLAGNSRENFNCPEPLAKRQHYKKFVGVVASCWVERKTGKYIMGKGGDKIFDVYTRALDKPELEKLPIQKPNGFEIEGKFIF